MPYSIFITPTATDDIAVAVEYYNALSPELGYRFADRFQIILTESPHYPQPQLSGIKIFAASQ